MSSLPFSKKLDIVCAVVLNFYGKEDAVSKEVRAFVDRCAAANSKRNDYIHSMYAPGLVRAKLSAGGAASAGITARLTART